MTLIFHVFFFVVFFVHPRYFLNKPQANPNSFVSNHALSSIPDNPPSRPKISIVTL